MDFLHIHKGTHLLLTQTLIIIIVIIIEQFSFELRKVIGLALSTLRDWRHFFIQSEVQPKPMVIRSHARLSCIAGF